MVWSLLVASGFNATSVHVYSSSEAGHMDLLRSEHTEDNTHMQHGFVSASIRFSMQQKDILYWYNHMILYEYYRYTHFVL